MPSQQVSSSTTTARAPCLAGKEMLLGSVALGAFSFSAIVNFLVSSGLLTSVARATNEMDAKYWTPVSMASWGHNIWLLIDVLVVAFLVCGLMRAKAGNSIPGFSCISLLLIPLSILNSFLLVTWGQECVTGTFVIVTLLSLGVNFLYCRVTRCAASSDCASDAVGGRCALLGGCRVNAPSVSPTRKTAAVEAGTVTPTSNTTTTTTETSRCPISNCLRMAIQTLWVRVWAPATIVAFLQFGFMLWKYVIAGSHPVAPRGTTIASNVAHAVVNKVAPNTKLIATLSNGEAVMSVIIILGLLGCAVTFAVLRRDGVPAFVFSWASFAIACHAATLGHASRVTSNTLSAIALRLSALASKFGVSGLYSLGGTSGEAWWSTIHDVAIGVGFACLIVGVTTTALKCILARRARKQLA